MAVAEQARAVLDLAKLHLPPSPRVVGIEAEPYVDSTGEDALRLWVLLEESTDVDRISGKAVILLKEAIHDALLRSGITEFPYISLVKPSERAELAQDVEE